MVTHEKMFKETEQGEINLFDIKVCFFNIPLVLHFHQLPVQLMRRVYFQGFD